MSVKIQICSLAVLEALLSGPEGKEVCLEIRQNIADTFAEKHIKPLMGDTMNQLVQRVQGEMTKEAIAAISKLVGSTSKSYGGYGVTLNEEIKKAIYNQANTMLHDFIKEEVESRIATATNEEALERAIDRCVDDAVAERIRIGVAARMAEISKLAAS